MFSLEQRGAASPCPPIAAGASVSATVSRGPAHTWRFAQALPGCGHRLNDSEPERGRSKAGHLVRASLRGGTGVAVAGRFVGAGSASDGWPFLSTLPWVEGTMAGELRCPLRGGLFIRLPPDGGR